MCGAGGRTLWNNVDAWAHASRLPFAIVEASLEDLVLAGYAEQLEGNWFVLTPRSERLVHVLRALEGLEAGA